MAANPDARRRLSWTSRVARCTEGLLSTRSANGDLVLAPPGNSGPVLLNATGEAIWERLDGRSVDQSLAEVLNDAETGDEAQVLAFVTDLIACGLAQLCPTSQQEMP